MAKVVNLEELSLFEKIKCYGIGRRKLDDAIFINDRPPPRLGVYDTDDENLCHEVIITSCTIPGCAFTAETLLEFEDHYNSFHRYSCAQCKKILPSPHFLDLHLQESHDSFFAVMSERKPSYCCYIEDCKQKFKNPAERRDHCAHVHKLPKDFRFEHNKKSNKLTQMVLNPENISKHKNKVYFNNNKQKTFPKYTGRKFTKSTTTDTRNDMDMEITVTELKEHLPE